jgi:hypothetical protein
MNVMGLILLSAIAVISLSSCGSKESPPPAPAPAPSEYSAKAARDEQIQPLARRAGELLEQLKRRGIDVREETYVSLTLDKVKETRAWLFEYIQVATKIRQLDPTRSPLKWLTNAEAYLNRLDSEFSPERIAQMEAAQKASQEASELAKQEARQSLEKLAAREQELAAAGIRFEVKENQFVIPEIPASVMKAESEFLKHIEIVDGVFVAATEAQKKAMVLNLKNDEVLRLQAAAVLAFQYAAPRWAEWQQNRISILEKKLAEIGVRSLPFPYGLGKTKSDYIWDIDHQLKMNPEGAAIVGILKEIHSGLKHAQSRLDIRRINRGDLAMFRPRSLLPFEQPSSDPFTQKNEALSSGKIAAGWAIKQTQMEFLLAHINGDSTQDEITQTLVESSWVVMEAVLEEWEALLDQEKFGFQKKDAHIVIAIPKMSPAEMENFRRNFLIDLLVSYTKVARAALLVMDYSPQAVPAPREELKEKLAVVKDFAFTLIDEKREGRRKAEIEKVFGP